MAQEYKKRFALAGNPNSGKTTLFNSLTGSTAHVGNWPGVTIDKREGSYRKLDEPIYVVDLPGIYSLSPYTDEEVVSRDYILNEKPDCVINVVDATNLERNLYLTTQLLEIDVPVVVALNMIDIVKKKGDVIDVEKLKKELGVPVVAVSALKEENLDILMREAVAASNVKRKGSTVLENKDLLHLINDVRITFESKGIENPLFHAIKLVELDELETKDHQDLLKPVEEFKATFKDETFGNDFEAFIANARYAYISKHYDVLAKTEEVKSVETKLTKSDKIDKVLTHRIWGLPIFIVIMLLIFHFTFSEDLFFMGKMGLTITNEGWINFFTGMGYEGEALEGIPSIGVWLQSWMGWLTGSIVDFFAGVMPEGYWFTSLWCDGILNGLDAVMSFIPQIMILFLFIAILEDSGYMARIAFILDRAFRKFGLSGKAFIPMLTGFGCSVPAIMATRTLEDQKEKNRTIRLMTCFSCGAKAPIWAMLSAVGGAVTGLSGDLFVSVIYIGGIACAIIFALFMKLFSKDTYVSPFIMELPAYHMPQFRNLMAHLWEKLKHYVIKAGTIITAALILIWFLSSFGFTSNGFEMVDMENSLLAYIGKGFRYLFYPLGWAQDSVDGWKYSVASVTGLVAKEDIVATMAVLLGTGEAEEEVAAAITLNGPAIWSYAAFNLFTIPCFAAIGAAHGEQKGKEFWLTLLWWFSMSYGVSLVVYWLGMLLTTILWLGIIVLVLLVGAVVAVGIVVSKRQKKASVVANA